MKLEAIEEKYCKGDLVQMMTKDGSISLIVSPNEIILLKDDNKIYINKYENHPNRYEFPYSEKEKNGDYFNGLYEYNKPYIWFYVNHFGYSLSMKYFLKGSNRALMYTTSLPIDLRSTQNIEEELTREEIEARFNKDNYDSMYIIDINANVFFINNSLEKKCFGNGFNFSDEEIIKRDLANRKGDQILANLFKADDKKINEEIKPKSIEEIKDLELYGGFIKKYSHLLLTSKDGVFSLMWFNIVFVEKDKFKLTYSVVPINIPTVDDIISYCKVNDIEYTPDPDSGLRSFDEGHTQENIESAEELIKVDTSVESQEEPESGRKRSRIPNWLQKLRNRNQK